MNVKIADRVKLAVIAVTSLIMVYALWVSRDHITHVALLIGLGGYQASTLFVLIDLPALIGKVLQLKYFAASTRRMGRKLMIGSGSLSLAFNVTSGLVGGGIGPAAYGAFIVGMFLLLENVVTRIKPAAAVTRAKNAASVKTKPAKPALTARQIGGQKAAATRKANAALAAAAAELEASYALPAATVTTTTAA
jgi:hypothetical protein